MKALVAGEPGEVALKEHPDPHITDGSILVRPSVVGMCGTDLEIIDGRIDPAYVRRPVVLGHEWSGIVVATKDDPDAPIVGARVVAEGIRPCRYCASCVAGDTNRCTTYDEFGFTRDGAAAELIAVPTSLVHVLAPAVSADSGALAEPAAVVMQALQRVQPRPGTRILVVGDGTVALLAATLARLWSPATVTMLGARADQAPLARTCQVDSFILDATAVKGYDLVIEAAGAAAAVTTALNAVVRGGHIVLLGLAGTGVTTPLHIDNIVNGDLIITGSFGYTSTAFGLIVSLLNAGKLDFTHLVTHRFPLDKWEEALSTLRTPSGTRGKVLLDIC